MAITKQAARACSFSDYSAWGQPFGSSRLHATGPATSLSVCISSFSNPGYVEYRNHPTLSHVMSVARPSCLIHAQRRSHGILTVAVWCCFGHCGYRSRQYQHIGCALGGNPAEEMNSRPRTAPSMKPPKSVQSA